MKEGPEKEGNKSMCSRSPWSIMDWIKPTLKCRRKWFQKITQSVASYLAMAPGQRQGITGPWGQWGCPKDPDDYCPCVAEVGEE